MPDWWQNVGSPEQAQQQVVDWWGGLSEEERRRLGGYWWPNAFTTPYGPTGASLTRVTGRTWVPFGAQSPGIAGTISWAGPQGQSGLGGDRSGQYQQLANLLFGRTMAQVSGEFGRRGLMGSTMYGAASARASAEAQLAAWQMEQTMRQLGMQERQVGIQEAQLRLNWLSMREGWKQWRAQMSLQDRWRWIELALAQIGGTVPYGA